MPQYLTLKPKRLFEEDFSDGTLGQFSVYGNNNGTVSVSGEEVTISNTSGSSTSYIGIETDVKFPVGTKLIAQSKNTEGRHAAVVGLSDPREREPYPHAENNPGPAASIYARADTPDSVTSVDSDTDQTRFSVFSQDPRNYQVWEIERPDSDTVKYYVNGELVKTYNVNFGRDCRVYFCADGYSNPCSLVINEVFVTEIDTSSDEAQYGVTADDTSNNGVLGGDTYTASRTVSGLFPGRGDIKTETINGKTVTVENDQYGKWVCVLNYEHYGGENPTVAPGSTFPQLPNGLSRVEDVQALGTSGELRHVDNITQYGTWSVDAVRLEAETENHGRRINYFTTDQTAIDAIVDNSTQDGGTALQADTYYSDHTAALPDVGNSATSTDSNHIFGYEFPMYQGGEHHWALAGSGNRWEVDDFPGDESQTTVHRVWVRVNSTPKGGGGDVTTTSTTETIGATGVASLGSALFSARGSPVDTSTTLSADTTLTTANGTTSVGNILLQVSAVQQQAVLSSVAGDQTVGSAVAEAVEGTALSIETVATFANSAVVSLGQVEGAQLDGVAAGATADVFAVLSAQSATAGAQTASLSTETQASALAQDATHAPLTPTMSIVIRVESSDLRVDGKFSDSLAASVGAQTFIKVAKTVGSTDTFESTGTASATPLLAPTTALLTGQAGDNTTTTSTLGALPHEFAGTGLVADPPTSSGATGSVVNAAPTDQVASGSQSSSRGGTRTSTTPTALTSVANTAAVSDIAPTVASALVQSGIVDSKADAAAAVAHLVARTARDDGFSTADAVGLLGEIDTTNLTARTAAFFLLFASLTGANEAVIQNESTVADLDESRTTVTIME
jgi:hypothetical protein